MKNAIYVITLVLMLSCNKKTKNIEINTSIIENLQSLKDTLSKAGTNLDSSKKELKASSNNTSVVTNDTLEINKQLNGVWNVIEMSIDRPDNIIGIIYMFDAKKKTLEVYNADELRGQYNYKIGITNCEGNKIKSDSCYIILSGDDNYCSEIIAIKYENNRIYLILKDFITESQDKEFLKISDNPKFFPKGFK